MELAKNWNGEIEDLYKEAVEFVVAEQKASTSFLQRKLKIGYMKAAHILDLLEERGVIGPQEGPLYLPRKVLNPHPLKDN